MDTVVTNPHSESRASTIPASVTDTGSGRWNSWIDMTLEGAVSWLLALLLFSAIAFMGGRYDWGWLAWSELVFVSTVTLATSLWLLRLALRPQLGFVFSWSLVLLATGGLIGILQLIALPQWVLGLCSPGLPSTLPLWWDDGAGSATLGAWTCASLVPYRTAESLRYFVLYCLTFLLVIQNVRTLTSVRRLLLVIFVLGIITALFALAQYVFWNKRFFWFFQIPWVPDYNYCRGTYTNKNHFAGLMAMVVGPGCYWLLTVLGLLNGRRSSAAKGRDYLIPIGCFAMGCLLVASFLSVSRGGIIATTLAFAIAAGGLTCFTRARRLWILIAILMCTIFAGFLSFAGTQNIQQRFAAIKLEHERPDTRLELDGRLALWQDLIKTVPDFPVMGTGFGTHQYVYQLYYGKEYETCFTHAENSYLQLLTEGGIATAVLVLLALCCICYWCIRSLRASVCPAAKPCVVAIIAALTATAFHGVVDFVWYIPSHALLIAVLAGLACVLARIQNPGKTIPLPYAPRGWVAATALACAFLFTAWLSTSFHHAQAALLWTEFQLSPDGQYPRENTDSQKKHDASILLTALEERPDHPRYHAKVAELLLQRFLQSSEWKAFPMPLSQIGAAVESSRFDTPRKRDRWLEKVYGAANRNLLESSRTHFEQAVRHYPLDAPSYLRLAELHFMAVPGTPSSSSLLAQAVKAEPFNPDVTYEAGRNYLLLEDIVHAMACWRQSGLSSEKHKQTILAQLTDAVPLDVLIEQFQPDYASLLWLCRERFAEPSRRGERLLLLSQARQLTLKGSSPAIVGSRMRELHEFYSKDNDPEQAGQCARTAVAAEPYLLSNRVLLARWLIQQRLFTQAKTELEWCAVREPGNAEVQALRHILFDAMNNRRQPFLTPQTSEAKQKANTVPPVSGN